jgi:hypothetical protein
VVSIESVLQVSKRKRQFAAKHPSLANKDVTWLRRLVQQKTKQKNKRGKIVLLHQYRKEKEPVSKL